MLAVLFLITAMTPVAAHACSCVSPGTVEQEKAQSTRVFLGRVTAIEERTPQMDKGWLTVIAEWITGFFGAEAPPTDRDFPYKRSVAVFAAACSTLFWGLGASVLAKFRRAGAA
jgi:hypothetical protein